MDKRTILLHVLAAKLLAPLALVHAVDEQPQRKPNILWFVVDGMSANFSCYGEKLVDTMAVYIGNGNPGGEKNIALMKKWAAERK